MASLARMMRPLGLCTGMLCTLPFDAIRFLRLCLRSPTALAAENLFLRQQLALYQEHHATPRRATDAMRFTLVWLSQWFDWQPALVVVQPETGKRWRRQRRQLCWRGTACPGRPPIPMELQRLIRQMARDDLTWGQRRIANALVLKLGLRVSPRTVRQYMPTYGDRVPGDRVPSRRWRMCAVAHERPLVHHGLWDRATLEGCLAMLQSARERREITLSQQCPVHDEAGKPRVEDRRISQGQGESHAQC